MTRQYSDSIALAAQNIVQSSGVDITQPVAILPLARQLMAETGCKIDAAKRHIARAVRLARGELTTSPTWGGRRTPAGGRPTMRYTVVVKDRRGATIAEYPDNSLAASNRLAREEAGKDKDNRLVFVTWFRARDGQHGYLNSNGSHAITGEAW